MGKAPESVGEIKPCYVERLLVALCVFDGRLKKEGVLEASFGWAGTLLGIAHQIVVDCPLLYSVSQDTREKLVYAALEGDRSEVSGVILVPPSCG